MATLTGRAPRDTYKDLLQVSNGNAGIDGTLRNVEDGEGTVCPLQLSQTAVNVAAGFQVGGAPVTAAGAAVLTAADAAAQRAALGLGTAAAQPAAAFATAAQGAKADAALTPAGVAAVALSGSYADLTGRPALAAVATSGGYADLTGRPALGTAAALNAPAAGNAAPGEVVRGSDTRLSDARTPLAHTHPAAEISDSTATGRALVTAATAAAARTALALGTSAPLNVAAAGNAAAGEVVKGDDSRLSDARTPAAHTHPAADISDATALSRAVLTAATTAARAAALGAYRARGTFAAMPTAAAAGAGADYFVTDWNTMFVSTGSYWKPTNGGFVLAQSGAAVTRTGAGSDTEAAMATVPVPAGLLTENSAVRVTHLWSVTNSVNAKTPRVRLGGLAGTVFFGPALTTVAGLHTLTVIRNANALAAQAAFQFSNTTGLGTATAATTGAVNTAAAQDLVLTGQLAVTAESITLVGYTVEILIP